MDLQNRSRPEAIGQPSPPSSSSEDYLAVLAGQRQWIATTNFAGCPGRPPDSFGNSAVLNYLGKVPDAVIGGGKVDHAGGRLLTNGD